MKINKIWLKLLILLKIKEGKIKGRSFQCNWDNILEKLKNLILLIIIWKKYLERNINLYNKLISLIYKICKIININNNLKFRNKIISIILLEQAMKIMHLLLISNKFNIKWNIMEWKNLIKFNKICKSINNS